MTASFRWRRRSEDWHAIASSVTTTTLYRYPIHSAASALDCDDGRRPTRGNRNEPHWRDPSRTRPANGVAQPCLSPPKMKPSPTLSASARTMNTWSKAAIRRLYKRRGLRLDLRVRYRAISPANKRCRCKSAIRTTGSGASTPMRAGCASKRRGLFFWYASRQSRW